jgi:antitoxin VapB
MEMTRTKIFQSNRSQAVRLPKEVAFPKEVKEVTVLREGKRRVIVPANSAWDDFFDSPGVDLGPRDQPQVQARDEF